MKRRMLTLVCGLLLAMGASGQAAAVQADRYGGWLVYWDVAAGLAEAETHQNRLAPLINFAIFFDEDDQLLVPDGLSILEASTIQLAAKGVDVYLSFVNDREKSGGGSELKSVALLKRLLEGDASRRLELADRMIALAVERGYRGIEVDFEGILSDMPLWEAFFTFVRDLYAKAQKEGLKVRILLEPRTPFDRLGFPEGPDYVMMAYNLHGTHNGPGPKANRDFLASLVGKMSVIPGKNRRFALALGGFDWSLGKVEQITYHQALQLLAAHDAEPRRKEEVAHFTYTDADGKAHEVWFADEITLAYWRGVLNGLGEYRIDLWRLGGHLPGGP